MMVPDGIEDSCCKFTQFLSVHSFLSSFFSRNQFNHTVEGHKLIKSNTASGPKNIIINSSHNGITNSCWSIQMLKSLLVSSMKLEQLLSYRQPSESQGLHWKQCAIPKTSRKIPGTVVPSNTPDGLPTSLPWLNMLHGSDEARGYLLSWRQL